jgi:acetyltransferase-like isoleucine patch superfamily enzyme
MFDRLRAWGIGTRVPLRLVAVNYLAKWLTGRSKGCRYPVHFSSTVVFGHKLKLLGSGRGTVASLALSGGCYVQAGHGIEIGEGTIWAPNVVMVSANHDMSKPDKAWTDTPTPITIGRDCWIGAGAIVLPGVTLGDRTVVGAGAVVTKSFPADSVLVGNPARAIQ